MMGECRVISISCPSAEGAYDRWDLGLEVVEIEKPMPVRLSRKITRAYRNRTAKQSFPGLKFETWETPLVVPMISVC